MSKNQLMSKAHDDKVTARLIAALGGGAGCWSLSEATRLERRAEYNLRKVTSRQVTRGTSRAALE